jgi:competence ComEA-like helix-hairpin-helix protein
MLYAAPLVKERIMGKAIDINDASVEDLERTFQINRERAQEILSTRQKLGGFKSWDDVKKVPGISDGMIDNMRQAGLTLGASGRH